MATVTCKGCGVEIRTSRYAYCSIGCGQIQDGVERANAALWGRCGTPLGGGRFCSLHHGHGGRCFDEQAAT